MLRLEAFELLAPDSLEEALSILRGSGDASVMAGGTDLVPKMKRAQMEPKIVVSLSRVAELDFVADESDRVRIGSRTVLKRLERSAELERFDCLREALREVATPIIRNSATIGGNLLQDTRCRYYDRSLFWRDALGYCLKKGGEDCKVAPGGTRCFATFCSDLAPALIVLGAEVKLVGEKERVMPLENLYRDDGLAHVTLDREILTEVIVPKTDMTSAYKKLRIRGGFDFPEAGVAVALEKSRGTARAHIAVTGIGPQIFHLRKVVEPDELPRLADTVYNSIKPMDTLFFPPSYRKAIVRTLLLQCFDELLAR